jgi:hypothetical protein
MLDLRVQQAAEGEGVEGDLQHRSARPGHWLNLCPHGRSNERQGCQCGERERSGCSKEVPACPIFHGRSLFQGFPHSSSLTSFAGGRVSKLINGISNSIGVG